MNIKKYYHITKKEYVDSILISGIKPGFKSGLTLHQRKHDKIFITDDTSRICRDQAGETWIKNNNLIVLEINVEGLCISPKKYYNSGTYTISDFEYEVDYIEPEKIKVMGNNELVFYCDDSRHLVCKPYSIRNLHLMGEFLGVKKCWFHKDHYDIPKKRIDEIKNMCIFVSSKEIVNIINNDKVQS